MAISLGKHLVAEFYNCNHEILDNPEKIQDIMVLAAKEAKATIVNVSFHHFSPIGVSGVVVIAESHLAIHTWPEYGIASVDIYTCGETIDPWVAFDIIQAKLEAQEETFIELKRGILPRGNK